MTASAQRAYRREVIRGAAGILVSVAVLGGLGGCADGPPVTELLVLADTDLARPADDPEAPPPGECAALPAGVDACELRLVKLDIDVPGDPGSPTGLTTIVDPAFEDHVEPPVSWGVVAPDGDPTAEVEIVLRGYFRGADEPESAEPPLVVKRARVAFVQDEIRLLCIHLEGSCAGVSCPAGQTCDEGSCKSTRIDSARLPVVDRGTDPPPCPMRWPAAAP